MTSSLDRALSRVERSLRGAVAELERLKDLQLDSETRERLYDVIRAGSLDLKLLELAARE